MFNEYEQDEQGETQGMKQLRQALEKANAALKARDEELGKLQGAVRTQSVREILRDLGVKPKVADLIPTSIESTADAVGKWVKDYEDVFGGLRQEEKATGSEPEPEPASEPARPSIDAQTQDAFQRLQQVEAAAGVVPLQKQEAQIAALKAAADEAGGDFLKLKNILSGF